MIRKIKRSLTLSRGLAAGFLVVVILVAYGSLAFPGLDPYTQNIAQKFSSFGEGGFLLGSDELGRDVFARLLYGVRIELVIAVLSTVIAMVGGSLLGLISGFYPLLGDLLLMRVVDVILSFPPVIIALLATALYGTNTVTLIFVMGILFIPAFARVVYGQVLSVMPLEFVEASKVFGAGAVRRLFTVVLPNCLTPIIVQFTVVMATAVLLESGLSFLGLGVQQPEPSLGSMVSTAQRFMSDNPEQLLLPALLVSLIILCFGVLGDFLRDLLDPRM